MMQTRVVIAGDHYSDRVQWVFIGGLKEDANEIPPYVLWLARSSSQSKTPCSDRVQRVFIRRIKEGKRDSLDA